MKTFTRGLFALMLALGMTATLQAQTSYTIDVTPVLFPAEISWELVDAGAAVVASRGCGSYGPATSDTVTLTDGADYTFNALDDWGDGWNGGGTYSISFLGGDEIASGSPDNGISGDNSDACDGSDVEESVTFTAGPLTTDVSVAVTPGSFPNEISYYLHAGADTVIAVTCGTLNPAGQNDTVTLNDGIDYTFDAYDDWGDGWNGGDWTITDLSLGAVLASGIANNGVAGDNTDDCIGQQLEESVVINTAAAITGCTDSTAINYNPAATVDDGSCLFPAANDACADAIDIPAGTCYIGTNEGATFGGDSLSAACVDGSLTPADIWFTTTIGASGTVQITLPIVPGATSIFELYLGTCDSLGNGILSGLGACNNYASGGGLTLSGLTGGDQLYIRYWDFGSDQFGGIEVCVSEPSSGCTDPCAVNYDSTATIDDGSCILDAINDACADATAVSAGTNSFLSSGATGTDATSCAFNDTASVWYSYMVPTGLDTVRIYTCGSTFDTGLSLWDACGGSEIACNDDGTPAGSGCSSLQSFVELTDSTLAAYAGSTVYIRIAGFNGSSGCGDLIIEEVAAPAPVCEAPMNLMAAPAGGIVMLSWDPVPTAVGYRVEGNKTSLLPATRKLATATNSKNAPIDCGEEYTWRVRALCADGTKSAYSAANSFIDTACGARMGAELTVEVYPNPASDVAVVSFTNVEEMVTIQLVDITGRVLSADQMMAVEGTNNYQIDIAEVPAGSYFVQISGSTVRMINLEVVH